MSALGAMASTSPGVDKGNDLGNTKGKITLPPFPGQDALLHEANKWREVRDDCLTEHGLLDVARGGEPRGIADLVDYDLSSMPFVPAGHPQALKQRFRPCAQGDH